MYIYIHTPRNAVKATAMACSKNKDKLYEGQGGQEGLLAWQMSIQFLQKFPDSWVIFKGQQVSQI